MRLYCPLCQSEATDESCPHWDYEHDPRVPATFTSPQPLPTITRDELANLRAAGRVVAIMPRKRLARVDGFRLYRLI